MSIRCGFSDVFPRPRRAAGHRFHIHGYLHNRSDRTCEGNDFSIKKLFDTIFFFLYAYYRNLAKDTQALGNEGSMQDNLSIDQRTGKTLEGFNRFFAFHITPAFDPHNPDSKEIQRKQTINACGWIFAFIKEENSYGK